MCKYHHSPVTSRGPHPKQKSWINPHSKDDGSMVYPLVMSK